jgi:hypothetical protein
MSINGRAGAGEVGETIDDAISFFVLKVCSLTMAAWLHYSSDDNGNRTC